MKCCFYKEKNSCKLKLQGHHEKPNGHSSKSGDAFLQQPWLSLQYSPFWRQSLNQTVLIRVLQHVNIKSSSRTQGRKWQKIWKQLGHSTEGSRMNHKGAEHTHLRFQLRHSFQSFISDGHNFQGSKIETPWKDARAVPSPGSSGVKYGCLCSKGSRATDQVGWKYG